MNVFDTSKSFLQEIQLEEHSFTNIKLFAKRDDLIHPEVSGNKWRKLKYTILKAKEQNKEGILTFGGAFSNHLIATASACHLLKLKSVGVVRGDELSEFSNRNLARCKELDMDLIFLSRSEYKNRNEPTFSQIWQQRYSDLHFVPEGGANKEGIIGCAEIWNELKLPVDHIFVAQGTSTTSCGLAIGNTMRSKLHVVPTLKGYNSLSEMEALLKNADYANKEINDALLNVVVHADGHAGGYAKSNEELLNFICYCNDKYQLPLDSIYTGKAFYSLINWLKTQSFSTPQNIVFLHTGGLLNG